jgi:hypothetical protein
MTRSRASAASLIGAGVLGGILLAVSTAAVGPGETVICGEGHLLNRLAQAIMEPLGAGHIDGPSASYCVVPSTTAWLLAIGVFLSMLAFTFLAARRWRMQTRLPQSMPGRTWLVAGTLIGIAAIVLVAATSTGPRGLPEPLREDFRSEFVSDEEGYRFWPRSAPVVQGVTYRYDTGHCGLDFMLDFDGTFWDPVNPNVGEEPFSFYEQDVGTIELVAAEEARFTSSSGREIRLVRIDGPIVTHPCA